MEGLDATVAARPGGGESGRAYAALGRACISCGSKPRPLGQPAEGGLGAHVQHKRARVPGLSVCGNPRQQKPDRT